MNEKEKYEKRCEEIQKEIKQMPLNVYIVLTRSILQDFKQYHPVEWRSIIKEETNVDLPWPYSVFGAMYETAKNAYQIRQIKNQR